MLSFFSLTRSELTNKLFDEFTDAERLSRRLFAAVYKRGVRSWNAVEGLRPAHIRWLEQNLEIDVLPLLRLHRSQINRQEKLLFGLRDGETFECSAVPTRPHTNPADNFRRLVGRLRRVGPRRFARDLDPREPLKQWYELALRRLVPRMTACLSTQVGCPMRCLFCASSADGLVRNLETHEIVSQVMALRRMHPIKGLAFFGMGEPLHNLDNLVKAIDILQDPDGTAYPNQRVLISTAGVVPKIDELATRTRVRLAVSLHAPRDTLRSALMPINESWNIASVLEAARRYAERARGPVLIEYALLAGCNDSVADARQIAKLLEGMDVTVDLIPHNNHEDSPFCTPSEASISAFARELRDHGLFTTIRGAPEGASSDIQASCGQLRRSSAADQPAAESVEAATKSNNLGSHKRIPSRIAP